MGFLLALPGGAKMAMLAAVAVALAMFYWHYTVVKGERDAAMAQVGALQVANEVQVSTISDLNSAVQEWAGSAAKMQETLGAMQVAQVEANKHQRRIADVLGKHNMEVLALAKPVLVERAVNRGTADVFSMFECATGGCGNDDD